MILNETVPAKVAFPPATDVNGTVAAPQTTEEESLHPASIQKQRGAPSAGYTLELGKKVRDDFTSTAHYDLAQVGAFSVIVKSSRTFV